MANVDTTANQYAHARYRPRVTWTVRDARKTPKQDKTAQPPG